MDECAQAIEQLYRQRYIGFRNALATVTGNHETAHDALQEGFARAFARRRQFRGEGSLAAWIWQIAFRAALETRRERDVSLDELAEIQVVEPERDPTLAAAIAALPPRRRLIVFLRYYADLSYGEIAHVSGVSVGTVSATLAQGHDALVTSLRQPEGVPNG